MKKLLQLLFFMQLSFLALSQDIIVKHDGKLIDCKITSEDSTKVEFDVRDRGKIKSTFLTKDKIKEIKYFKVESNNINNDKFIIKRGSKYYVDNKKLNSEELSITLSKNAEAYRIYEKAKKLQPISYLLAGVGGFILGRSLVSDILSSEAKTYGIVTSVGLIGTGFLIEGNLYNKTTKAVNLYNNSISSMSSSSHDFNFRIGMTPNGIGIVVGI